MTLDLSRRRFLGLTAGALATQGLWPRYGFGQPAAGEARSTVALVRGEKRRVIIKEALEAVEEQILPRLLAKKYVLIKPNLVSKDNPLATTNAEAIHGILDFIAPRFKGPVVIAESSAGNTMEAFESHGFAKIASEHKPRPIDLVDLNQEERYETLSILDGDLHPQPVRLAGRLFDPDAFVIALAVLKTHNAAIVTLAVKNMALGAPLRSAPNQRRWSDKRVYHGGVRQIHYDIFLTAQRLQPFWGAAVIDGFEGMEGNGPHAGTAVPSRIAIASTDYVAADRVAVEAMGIDASWVGYLTYCGQLGVGEYDLGRIEVRGEKLDAVRKKYLLHQDIELMLQWRGPMTELPPRLG